MGGRGGVFVFLLSQISSLLRLHPHLQESFLQLHAVSSSIATDNVAPDGKRTEEEHQMSESETGSDREEEEERAVVWTR